MAQTINLKIVGDNQMNCGGCERSVKATLMDVPGVAAVSADHTTQNVVVTLADNSVAPTILKQELAEIGYAAELA